MGASKTTSFNEKQNNIATIAKALGHPARIAIIEHLLKVDSCICDEIVTKSPLSQPTISQHLTTLRSAGIIKGNVKKNTLCYCIDQKGIEKLRTFLNDASVKLSKKNTAEN